MDNLSREQVIAVFSLAFAILSTLAAAFAVPEKRTRFLLIVFTLALSFTSCTYLYTNLYNEKSSKELSKEEMIQEVKRKLQEEQTRQDEFFKQARERLDKEQTEREAAEKAAKEAHNQDEIEREAREIIIREDTVKKLREQIESEKAEKTRQVAEALIIGEWNSTDTGWWASKKVEFAKDGKYYNRSLAFVSQYRVVDATHVDIKTPLDTYITYEFEVSGNTLHFIGGTFTRVK